MITRQEKAQLKIADIEKQIEALVGAKEIRAVQGLKMGHWTEAIEFQIWRKRVLEQYADKPDRVLKSRLTTLRKKISPELWNARYSANLSQVTDVEKKIICEAFLLEYLLGIYPGGEG